MPKPRYFASLAGALALGLASLVLAGLLFFFLLPFLLPAAFGGALLVMAFLALWGIVYVAMVIGTAIIYLFRPMEVSRKDRKYTSASMKIREAGRRERGKTREKK